MSRSSEMSKCLQLYDHVLITGASGGIGAALAQHYAAQAQRISLWGRDLQRLESLAKICSAAGAETDIVVVDLSNMQESLDAFSRAEAQAPIDLLFLNAGVSDMRQPGRVVETPDILLETALVNYAVPTGLASVAAELMVKRRRGHIVFTGSVAAWHDLPFSAAYCASKAGIERFAGALRAAVTPYNVNVTLVSFGFIDTRMSRRINGFKPFLAKPEKAVSVINKALKQRRGHVTFPKIFNLLRMIEAVTPRNLAHMLLRSIRVSQGPC